MTREGIVGLDFAMQIRRFPWWIRLPAEVFVFCGRGNADGAHDGALAMHLPRKDVFDS